MFKWVSDIYNGLYGSFDNKKDSGFSARKLTAWFTMLLITYLHYHVNPLSATTFLLYDQIFVAFLLGLVTTEAIIKFKNGFGDNNNNNNNNNNSGTSNTDNQTNNDTSNDLPN